MGEDLNVAVHIVRERVDFPQARPMYSVSLWSRPLAGLQPVPRVNLDNPRAVTDDCDLAMSKTTSATACPPDAP
jgi:hypothetical protein